MTAIDPPPPLPTWEETVAALRELRARGEFYEPKPARPAVAPVLHPVPTARG